MRRSPQHISFRVQVIYINSFRFRKTPNKVRQDARRAETLTLPKLSHRNKEYTVYPDSETIYPKSYSGSLHKLRHTLRELGVSGVSGLGLKLGEPGSGFDKAF